MSTVKFSHVDSFVDKGMVFFGSDNPVVRHRVWFVPVDNVMLINYDERKKGELTYIMAEADSDGNLSKDAAISALKNLNHYDLEKCEITKLEVIE